jgi:hypothetical protein
MPDSDYRHKVVTSCRLYVLNVPVRYFRELSG